jgi:hypothetical protein
MSYLPLGSAVAPPHQEHIKQNKKHNVKKKKFEKKNCE